MFPSFKYLGRAILEADDYWPEVVKKLARARTVWYRIPSILSREGARLRVSIFFFKSIVQPVLIFGAETWVVTPCMGRVLGGFQDQVARRLVGRIPWWRLDGR